MNAHREERMSKYLTERNLMFKNEGTDDEETTVMFQKVPGESI